MNAKQRDDLLEALGDCRPRLKLSALKRALSGPGPRRWSVGLLAGQPWSAVAVAEAQPWLARVWDLKTGRPRPAAAKTEWTRRPFSPKVFGEPALESALADFSALHPPAALLLEARAGRPTGRWALPLRQPPAWPHFLRCDLAARFGPDSPLLSLLARDLAVEALVFDGRGLWAFVG